MNSEELREIYNERYENDHAHQINTREIDLYEKYFHLLKLGKKKFATHLDIGCGMGHKTVAFGKNSEKILAIDLSDYVIDVVRKMYSHKKKITFSTQNILETNAKFEFITALGLSLINEPNIDVYIGVVTNILKQNLTKTKGSALVISSFTDFSGGNIESWYYHTEGELDELMSKLNAIDGFTAKIIFPHKIRQNYLNYGVYNFLAEIYKGIKSKRRNYFIVIEHE